MSELNIKEKKVSWFENIYCMCLCGNYFWINYDEELKHMVVGWCSDRCNNTLWARIKEAWHVLRGKPYQNEMFISDTDTYKLELIHNYIGTAVDRQRNFSGGK